MPHVSLRVTEEEKRTMDAYANVHGIAISEAVKEAFFRMLEDEYDLRVIQEHEAEKAKGGMKYYSHEEVGKMLGLK